MAKSGPSPRELALLVDSILGRDSELGAAKVHNLVVQDRPQWAEISEKRMRKVVREAKAKLNGGRVSSTATSTVPGSGGAAAAELGSASIVVSSGKGKGSSSGKGGLKGRNERKKGKSISSSTIGGDGGGGRGGSSEGNGEEWEDEEGDGADGGTGGGGSAAAAAADGSFAARSRSGPFSSSPPSSSVSSASSSSLSLLSVNGTPPHGLSPEACGGVFPEDVVTLKKKAGLTKSGSQWLGVVKKAYGFVSEQEESDPDELDAFDPLSGPLKEREAQVLWLFPERKEERVLTDKLMVLDRMLMSGDCVRRATAQKDADHQDEAGPGARAVAAELVSRLQEGVVLRTRRSLALRSLETRQGRHPHHHQQQQQQQVQGQRWHCYAPVASGCVALGGEPGVVGDWVVHAAQQWVGQVVGSKVRVRVRLASAENENELSNEGHEGSNGGPRPLAYSARDPADAKNVLKHKKYDGGGGGGSKNGAGGGAAGRQQQQQQKPKPKLSKFQSKPPPWYSTPPWNLVDIVFDSSSSSLPPLPPLSSSSASPVSSASVAMPRLAVTVDAEGKYGVEEEQARPRQAEIEAGSNEPLALIGKQAMDHSEHEPLNGSLYHANQKVALDGETWALAESVTFVTPQDDKRGEPKKTRAEKMMLELRNKKSMTYGVVVEVACESVKVEWRATQILTSPPPTPPPSPTPSLSSLSLQLSPSPTPPSPAPTPPPSRQPSAAVPCLPSIAELLAHSRRAPPPEWVDTDAVTPLLNRRHRTLLSPAMSTDAVLAADDQAQEEEAYVLTERVRRESKQVGDVCQYERREQPKSEACQILGTTTAAWVQWADGTVTSEASPVSTLTLVRKSVLGEHDFLPFDFVSKSNALLVEEEVSSRDLSASQTAAAAAAQAQPPPAAAAATAPSAGNGGDASVDGGGSGMSGSAGGAGSAVIGVVVGSDHNERTARVHWLTATDSDQNNGGENTDPRGTEQQQQQQQEEEEHSVYDLQACPVRLQLGATVMLRQRHGGGGGMARLVILSPVEDDDALLAANVAARAHVDKQKQQQQQLAATDKAPNGSSSSNQNNGSSSGGGADGGGAAILHETATDCILDEMTAPTLLYLNSSFRPYCVSIFGATPMPTSANESMVSGESIFGNSGSGAGGTEKAASAGTAATSAASVASSSLPPSSSSSLPAPLPPFSYSHLTAAPTEHLHACHEPAPLVVSAATAEMALALEMSLEDGEDGQGGEGGESGSGGGGVESTEKALAALSVTTEAAAAAKEEGEEEGEEEEEGSSLQLLSRASQKRQWRRQLPVLFGTLVGLSSSRPSSVRVAWADGYSSWESMRDVVLVPSSEDDAYEDDHLGGGDEDGWEDLNDDDDDEVWEDEDEEEVWEELPAGNDDDDDACSTAATASVVAENQDAESLPLPGRSPPQAVAVASVSGDEGGNGGNGKGGGAADKEGHDEDQANGVDQNQGDEGDDDDDEDDDEECFGCLSSAPADHHFLGKEERVSAQKVKKEWTTLRKGLTTATPTSSSSSSHGGGDGGDSNSSSGLGMVVRAYEDRADLLRALIAGPKETPYEGVPFFFDVQLPADFPNAPPKVHYLSTSSERLNPNLYDDGKVCLSLLGTWSGPGWVPGQSTLLQVLLSIQALILVDLPFFNEPGFEKQQGTPEGFVNAHRYNEKARLLSLRAAVRLARHPPTGFATHSERFFLKHGRSLVQSVQAQLASSSLSSASPPTSEPENGSARGSSVGGSSGSGSNNTDSTAAASVLLPSLSSPASNASGADAGAASEPVASAPADDNQAAAFPATPRSISSSNGSVSGGGGSGGSAGLALSGGYLLALRRTLPTLQAMFASPASSV